LYFGGENDDFQNKRGVGNLIVNSSSGRLCFPKSYFIIGGKTTGRDSDKTQFVIHPSKPRREGTVKKE
jgi:hypothetical protein